MLRRPDAGVPVRHDRGVSPEPPRPVPPDYDGDPGRFRLARSVLREHALVEDVHERVARRILAERLAPVLDVGCGEGELAPHLPEGAWVGVDSSATTGRRSASAAATWSAISIIRSGPGARPS
jgi:SAM-dependent methyltransferase